MISPQGVQTCEKCSLSAWLNDADGADDYGEARVEQKHGWVVEWVEGSSNYHHLVKNCTLLYTGSLTLTLVHCCTMSLCFLGSQMIITEIQIQIQRSSRGRLTTLTLPKPMNFQKKVSMCQHYWIIHIMLFGSPLFLSSMYWILLGCLLEGTAVRCSHC